MSKSALKVRDMFQITVDLYYKFQSYFQFFEVIKSYQNYSCQHKNAIRKPGFELHRIKNRVLAYSILMSILNNNH